MQERRADILVVGAGIAGVSVAAECSHHGKVILLEAESHPGIHATGRSAAFFAPAYGNTVVRGFTAASESFYRQPLTTFFSPELLRPRDCVFIARSDQQENLSALGRRTECLQALELGSLEARLEVLRPGQVAAALIDSTGGDLDVDLILGGYLRQFQAQGGQLRTRCEVRSLKRKRGLWHLHCDDEHYTAPIVINAAGAWADTLAERLGLERLGIQPKRRTAVLVDAPSGVDVSNWPMVVDVDEEFYFKPEAGTLLLSPADETICVASDAQAEEWDVAVAIDRVLKVLDLDIRRVNHRWAGLRSFAADNTFVVGEDPRAEGFFWLAGQGGYGVQAAPALAILACHLVTKVELDRLSQPLKEYITAVDPARFIR